MTDKEVTEVGQGRGQDKDIESKDTKTSFESLSKDRSIVLSIFADLSPEGKEKLVLAAKEIRRSLQL